MGVANRYLKRSALTESLSIIYTCYMVMDDLETTVVGDFIPLDVIKVGEINYLDVHLPDYTYTMYVCVSEILSVIFCMMLFRW